MKLEFTLPWGPISATQLAFYCSAVGVADPIHYDRATVAEVGMKDVVANGSLRVAMIEVAIRRAFANHPDLLIEKLECRHRAPLYRGQTARIRVVSAAAAGRIDCQVETTVEDSLVDSATAELSLPESTLIELSEKGLVRS